MSNVGGVDGGQLSAYADGLYDLVVPGDYAGGLGACAWGYYAWFSLSLGGGRLIIKESILLAASVATLADSAQAYLRRG